MWWLSRILSLSCDGLCVYKANGYGHGDIEISIIAIEAGATHLAVAFLDEALKLREYFKNIPILVLEPIRIEDVSLAADKNIILTAHAYEWLKKINIVDRSIKIHIKLDTGMNRIGIKDKDEFEKCIKYIKSNKSLNLDGIYTYFSTADSSDIEYFNNQVLKFKENVNSFLIMYVPK